MQTSYERPWGVPPMQTSYVGPFFWTNCSGLYITGPTSAEIWNGRVYTCWRAALWRLDGVRGGHYDPAAHWWSKEK